MGLADWSKDRLIREVNRLRDELCRKSKKITELTKENDELFVKYQEAKPYMNAVRRSYDAYVLNAEK